MAPPLLKFQCNLQPAAFESGMVTDILDATGGGVDPDMLKVSYALELPAPEGQKTEHVVTITSPSGVAKTVKSPPPEKGKTLLEAKYASRDRTDL